MVHMNGALMMLKSILLVLELKSYMTRAYQTWKEKTFKKKWRPIVVTAMITLGTEFNKLTRFFLKANNCLSKRMIYYNIIII